MPKNKTHKGLLKRVRVTKTGKIKLYRACGRHLRSHKPGSLIRSYRRPKFASAPDARRLRRVLGLKVHKPYAALTETPAGTPAAKAPAAKTPAAKAPAVKAPVAKAPAAKAPAAKAPAAKVPAAKAPAAKAPAAKAPAKKTSAKKPPAKKSAST